MGYIYKRCSRCGLDKKWNRSAYCSTCSKEYHKTYKLLRTKKPSINIEGLRDFIEKIEKNRYYIDFKDINIILFFYEILSTNLNEYNDYTTGEQIEFMWKRIINYYKINSKQKNI